MSFNVNFLEGSNVDKEFMTTHLLTGIVARKVVNNVIDVSSNFLDLDCRKILHDLWLENLHHIGGLPVPQEQLGDTQFGLDSMRMSRRFTEPLPPMVAKGPQKKPDLYMKRPVLMTKSTASESGIIESYVLRTVRNKFLDATAAHPDFK